MNSAFDIAFGGIQEEQTETNLPVQGKIPEWVNGSLYRNGPGLFSTDDASFKHWFDGLAIVHKFNIQKGGVSYTSKYLETNTRDSLIDKGTISYPEFATDPCGSIFKKMSSWFIGTNPKIGITQVNDRLLAMGETMLQLELDKDTLKTLGVHRYTNFKYTPSMTTAHPHVLGNDLYNLVLKMGVFNFYDIVKYDVESKRSKSICKIPVANPSYIHSIGMSENYIILAHFPFECTTIEFVLKHKPFIENFKWKDKKKTILWIIDKSSGKIIAKEKVDPFFAFHFINAYEEEGELIFDLCNYPDASVVSSFYFNKLSDLQSDLQGSRIERFVFHVEDKALRRSTLSETPVELLTIDDRLLRKDYTHVYGLGISSDGSRQFYDQLVKHNLKTGETNLWKDPDYYPGEPKFIPRENGTDDDDGIIISILINIKNKDYGSKLLFLDAKTFTEIASCHTPHSIIPGFHSYFLT